MDVYSNKNDLFVSQILKSFENMGFNKNFVNELTVIYFWKVKYIQFGNCLDTNYNYTCNRKIMYILQIDPNKSDG